MLLASLAVLIASANAWISISQARYGASIEHIYNESLGTFVGAPQDSLGYLWTAPQSTDPQDSESSQGLGASITWAWDDALCDRLQPTLREDFWYISFVSCANAKASMHRAFDTWAMNSRHVKFTDVSEQCTAAGYRSSTDGGRCPLAEIWVTGLPSNVTSADATEGAVATPISAFSSGFRSTNGERPFRLFGSGANTYRPNRQVVETRGGSIEFRTNDVCWYLDSRFCYPFHEIKRSWRNADAVYAVGVTLMFTLWGIAVVVTIVVTMVAFKKAARMHLKVDTDDDGSVSFIERASASASRAEAFLGALGDFSIVGTALRILLLISPWPFYSAIFKTCWDCYDFEAAAAHEVGHLLGLGHPDLAGLETVLGHEPVGENSYHEGLAAGIPFNRSTCLSPWAGVRAGLPPAAVLDPRTGTRLSIMNSFSQNNPEVCLQLDDLEALNVLYPDCEGAAPLTPVCLKATLNIGWVRVLVFIFIPALVALLSAVVIHHFAARQILKRHRKAQGNESAHPTTFTRVGTSDVSGPQGAADKTSFTAITPAQSAASVGAPSGGRSLLTGLRSRARPAPIPPRSAARVELRPKTDARVAFRSHGGANVDEAAFESESDASAVCGDIAQQMINIHRDQTSAGFVGCRLNVEGHTSAESHGHSFGVRLSRARARLCADLIKAKLRELDRKLTEEQVSAMVKPLGFGNERPLPGYDDGGNYPENRRIQFILEPQDYPEANGAIELVSVSHDGSRLVLGKPITFEPITGKGAVFESKRLATRICFDAAEQLHELNSLQHQPYRLCVHSHMDASDAPEAMDASNARARLCAETIKGKMLQLDGQLSKAQADRLVVPMGFGAGQPLPDLDEAQHTANDRLELHLEPLQSSDSASTVTTL